MGRVMQISDSVVIKADAQTIWKQVADPQQMPRWSPENTAARTQTPPRPLEVGEVFEGSNRRGPAIWVTESVVTESEPGRRFTFAVRRIGPRSPLLRGSIATWSYEFEDLGSAARVTETWTDDRRWPDWTAWLFDRIVTRGRSFADFQRLNVHRTLMAMKDEFEAGR